VLISTTQCIQRLLGSASGKRISYPAAKLAKSDTGVRQRRAEKKKH
jgi:hypothetical protein